MMKLRLLVISTCLLTSPAFGQNNYDDCKAQAKQPLELSYCDIRKVSKSKTLPSLDIFKKNPDNIQRLMLKREAEKYGIELPSLAIKTTKPKKIIQTNKTSPKVQPSLSHCTLTNDHISCKDEYYSLVKNLKNNQLKSSTFSQYNQLELPLKSQTPFKDDSDYRYLSDIYPAYIYKMLELGLGDSTMSFTKFATVYWQSKMEDLNFSDRFNFMYNQLKIEKSRNQISARYRDNYPTNIRQCMRLDKKIIVCDDMSQNWIYKLK